METGDTPVGVDMDHKNQNSNKAAKNTGVPSAESAITPAFKTEFTPGPWLAAPDGDHGEWGIDSESGWGICAVAADCDARGLDSTAESDANARLIAAAPAMYAALKFQREALEDLIERFGVDGNPELHACLANMRDDVDAALTLATKEE